MTDGEVVAITARMQRLSDNIMGLLNKLEDHPNGEALLTELHENGLGYSWVFASITHSHLVHPERWQCVSNTKLRYVGKAVKAAESEV